MIEQVQFLAHVGFIVACAVVFVLLVAELGVWLGVLGRKGDDEK